MTKNSFVTFLLDETGSMESIKSKTIEGFNAYLDGISKLEGDGIDCRFSLIKFNSSKTTVVCSSVAPKLAPRLNFENYNPNYVTPLYDALMKAIKATEEKIGSEDVNVEIAVQTDGYENASKEFTLQQVVDKVKEKTDKGWLFTFIGANMDAWGQASVMGFSAANTMSYEGKFSMEAMSAKSRSTRAYANTGAVADAAFTQSERKQSGEDTIANTNPKASDEISL